MRKKLNPAFWPVLSKLPVHYLLIIFQQQFFYKLYRGGYTTFNQPLQVTVRENTSRATVTNDGDFFQITLQQTKC